MKRLFTKITALILAITICVSFAGCNLFKSESFVPDLPDSKVLAESYGLSTTPETGRTILSRVEAVAKVERSIVAIKMQYPTTGTSKGTSYGSGVIVDNADATDNVFYVLTCHHVIDSKGDITVYVPDKNTRNFTDNDYDDDFAFTGVIEDKINNKAITLIGGDKLADVAVLKLDVTNTNVSKDDIVCSVLPPESYQMMRGESVFAIGNPSGTLPMTVSDGIISYLDREVGISEVGYMNLMQIDVQINHGSSGGGLFNYYGELIGITNAGSETYDGINYTIPYELTYSQGGGFVEAATQLIATHYETFEEKNFGYITGSWEIGITLTSKTSFNTTLVMINSVASGSNADNAQLKAGDVVKSISCSGKITYNSGAISSVEQFASAIAHLRSYLRCGDSFSITIDRNGVEMTPTVELTKQFVFCDTGYREPIEAKA